ncbi:MAG: alpha/beta hydrolase [Parachlamydiales bacterium]|jgi:acetyl esterase
MGKLSPILENYLKQSPLLPNLETLSIPDLRKQFNDRQIKFNEKAPSYDLSIQNSTIMNFSTEIPIRIYRKDSDKLQPVLIFFHGGGFVFGNLDTLECHCREIAHFANCMVISVDYPLAPENPFPAAPEALYAATTWIYEHLEQWNGDRKRLFVGGSSSGSTLAAVVCMMVRDRGGAEIQGQILLCPMTDDNFDTVSYLENASGYNLTREQCIWFISQYAPEKEQRQNPLALPLKSANFQDLPSALVVTAEYDPLRDDGRGYAIKLQEAGVNCMDLFFKGMVHGFPTLPLDLPEKSEVLTQISRFIHS